MNLARRNFGFFESMSFTNKLIIVNLVVYFLSIIIIAVYGDNFFIDNISLTPSLAFQGKTLWTFFTSMFSHIMFFHIFANMFSLFFIGNFLEKIIGGRRLVTIYLISGLLGGIFFVLSGFIFNNDISGIGASGAIFGILGVLSVLVPYSKISLITGPLILIFLQVVLQPFIPTNLLSIFSLLFNTLVFVMIFSMLSFSPSIRRFALPIELRMWLLPIVAIVPLTLLSLLSIYNSLIPRLPIGNSAHIGGLFAGLIYGFYLRRKFPNKVKKISKYFH